MPGGFTYDGRHSSEFGIYLAQNTRRLHGGTRERRVTVPGRAGVYDAGSELDVTQVDLQLAIVAASRRDLVESLHEFAALLDPTKGYRPLVYDDDPFRAQRMKLVGEVPSNLVLTHSQFNVTMQAADPFYYDLEPTVVTWDAPAGSSTTFVNPGTVASPVRIEIQPLETGVVAQAAAGMGTTGALIAPLSGVTLDVSGVSVGYSGQILPTDVVIVDTDSFTVELNGDPTAVDDWTGEMPKLPPGTVALAEQDAQRAGATFTLTYTPRYL